MKVTVIGGHGGRARGARTTSYLIDDALLLDAGSAASHLSVEDQLKIGHVLISHAHLDHICELAFLADNRCTLGAAPLRVHASPAAGDIIRAHLFNDVVWPDFTRLPSESDPAVRIHPLGDGELRFESGHRVRAVPVNHPAGGRGFIVSRDGSAVLFTQDTGPTEDIWRAGGETRGLKAVFTEVSFPNRLGAVARDSFHHTPATLAREMGKMPPDVPILVGHLKPPHEEELKREIEALGSSRVTVLGSGDDLTHRF